MTTHEIELPFAKSLEKFARALWGLEVRVRALPAQGDAFTPRRPRFVAASLWLPASPLTGVTGSFLDYSIAAVAHLAAHLRFGSARFLVSSLKPAQVAITSLLEDARVERLAALEYPGLSRAWSPFHQARAEGAKTGAALLARLARALHDDAYVDADAWVSKGRALFWEARNSWHDAELSRRIGSLLGNDLGQMRVQFNARDYVVEPPYRDDHVGLWQFEQESSAQGTELESEGARRRDDAPTDDGRADAGRARPHTVGAPVDSPAQRSAPEAELAPEAAIVHAEWDYVIRRERAAFCTVRERVPATADPGQVDAALALDTPTRRRLEQAALRLASERPIRQRRLTDGDRLDLPAVIATVVAGRCGASLDPRVYRRVRFHAEPPALLLLLDLSESLNESPAGSTKTLVALARSASGLLATTLTGLSPDFAIHGFSSNGRHDVGYYRFKDFDEPYDGLARARLAGMRAGLSTRLGTALRHAGRALRERPAQRKLLLVVSDGEPSDVDVHDPEYLVRDAQYATVRNRRFGVQSFCVGLDSKAEASVERIFGRRNYLLLEQLDNLPRTVSELYLRLSA